MDGAANRGDDREGAVEPSGAGVARGRSGGSDRSGREGPERSISLLSVHGDIHVTHGHRAGSRLYGMDCMSQDEPARERICYSAPTPSGISARRAAGDITMIHACTANPQAAAMRQASIPRCPLIIAPSGRAPNVAVLLIADTRPIMPTGVIT